jgi:hypothetical protein
MYIRSVGATVVVALFETPVFPGDHKGRPYGGKDVRESFAGEAPAVPCSHSGA